MWVSEWDFTCQRTFGLTRNSSLWYVQNQSHNFRWVWGSWKSSQMICHIPKHGFWHPNQVWSMFWTKVIISLHEDVLDLLQPLHLVLDLLDRADAHENGPTWFPMPKNMGFDTKIKCLYHDQKYLTLSEKLKENLIPPDFSRVLLFGAPVWATRDSHFWIPH